MKSYFSDELINQFGPKAMVVPSSVSLSLNIQGIGNNSKVSPTSEHDINLTCLYGSNTWSRHTNVILVALLPVALAVLHWHTSIDGTDIEFELRSSRQGDQKTRPEISAREFLAINRPRSTFEHIATPDLDFKHRIISRQEWQAAHNLPRPS